MVFRGKAKKPTRCCFCQRLHKRGIPKYPFCYLCSRKTILYLYQKYPTTTTHCVKQPNTAPGGSEAFTPKVCRFSTPGALSYTDYKGGEL